MKAPVFTLTGPSKNEVELSESIFSGEVNPSLMAQAVRVYLANQRQGNANTKGRGEVTGSTRKIYKQKGTGNARHGDIKAPVFVGGGIVFGPVTHPFTMSFPVKMRRAALRSALSSQSGKVAVMDGFAGVEAKTKVVLSAVEKAVGESKKPLVVITGEMEAVKKALGNAQGFDFMNVTDLNTYEVLNHDVLVIAQEALPILEEWLGKK